ncbi:MAG: sugar ABC transporter ATP-binding protein [Planctomycetota bacterium]
MAIPTADSPPLLEVREISKSFFGVPALRNVSLSLRAGEVHAVIGENGAGKSTLMKVLAGVLSPDSGQIRLDGTPVSVDSPQTAFHLGIAMIHQELNLCDNLDIGANIYLGREPTSYWQIDDARIYRNACRHLEAVGLEVSPRTRVDQLTIGKQQLVEIAKAISVDAKLVIMDEPTSSLSQQEATKLFAVIRRLRDQGVAIVYISHRLAEVSELADRVSVLRDGEVAGSIEHDQITHDNMVQLMVGRNISQSYARGHREIAQPMLSVNGLRTELHPAHPLEFEVHAGEIVGLAGLVGAGRTEVLTSLFGVESPISGNISIDGHQVMIANPREAIAAGIALVPEDRKQQGLILEESIRHNVGLTGLKRHRRIGGFANYARELEDTNKMSNELRIKSSGNGQLTKHLSGGNQQKVVLAKWLAMQPRVLLLDEPTRGVDIGAKQEIYRLIEQLAQRGVAILFASSEMEEVLSLSDRVLVMHEGQLTGEIGRDALSEERIMQLATGSDLVQKLELTVAH